MFASLTDPALIDCINNGGVVVIPTDTLYGIVARAEDKSAVERVYRIRGRSPNKACINLVASMAQITDDSLWTAEHKKLAQKYWPGPLSLIAPTAHTPTYLHRGLDSLAYRVPDREDLRELLEHTGMLIAPSANVEGSPPATTVAEAYHYFGDYVDGYVDGGTLDHVAPSTLVTLIDGKVKVLRQGILHISEAKNN
jgi:L-threonylcarbamoyladenylate synthase